MIEFLYMIMFYIWSCLFYILTYVGFIFGCLFVTGAVIEVITKLIPDRSNK